MLIEFADGAYAWEDFNEKIQQIVRENNFKDIAEIGGGANPLLSLKFIEENGLNYDIYDVSEEELVKASPGYSKKILDFEKTTPVASSQYDFIFAQMTLEHIRDTRTFYANVYKSLKPGGRACFFFACITSLPSTVNFLIPEYLSSKILLALQPFRKNEKHGKFKAYYKWCYGPTTKNISRFTSSGFEVLSYTGYFGHSYYQKIGVLNYLEKIKTRFLLKHPATYLCSYAHVLLQRTETNRNIPK